MSSAAWDIPSTFAAFSRHRDLFAERRAVAKGQRLLELDRAVAGQAHHLAGIVPDAVILELVRKGT